MDQDRELPGESLSASLTSGRCDLPLSHDPFLLQQNVYRQRDVDNSGTMSSTEMRSAVEEAGKAQTSQ